MGMKLVKKIGLVLLIAIFLFIILNQVAGISATKEKALKWAGELFENVHDEGDYDSVSFRVEKTDGSKLSNEEITNFLINSELYRFGLSDSNSVEYICKTNFFNPEKAVVYFQYTAKNGDIINGSLDFISDGISEYFIADDLIQETEKEKIKYPFYYDLLMDADVNIHSTDKDVIKPFYRIIVEDNRKAYYEVVEECKEDLILSYSETIKKEIPAFAEAKNIELVFEDDDFEVISAYIDSEFVIDSTSDVWSKLAQSALPNSIMAGASFVQPLKGNSDWHCRVDYYDINTREFIETVVVR